MFVEWDLRPRISKRGLTVKLSTSRLKSRWTQVQLDRQTLVLLPPLESGRKEGLCLFANTSHRPARWRR